MFQMVDNSVSDLNELGQQLESNSKFDHEIGICLQSEFDSVTITIFLIAVSNP